MVIRHIKFIIGMCAIMLLLHIVNVVLEGQLIQYGILPGELSSLPYIFSAPWLHGSWGHLFNNLVGLAIFSALCLIRGTAFFVRSSLIIITLTGALVWLFGRSGATHIGASGWIFGLWSLSIALAWFDRSFLSIVIAIFVAIFYGGMAWGMLPVKSYISFESHLFGAVSGVVAAYTLTRSRQVKLRKP